VRLLDIEKQTQQKLGSLPEPAYRCAMCAIGELVVALYSQYYPASVRVLARRTLDATLAAVRSGSSAGSRLAAGIPREWEVILENDDDVEGPNAGRTAILLLAALSDDISNEGRTRYALTFVTASIATYAGRQWVDPGPRIVINPRMHEADDTSPGVDLLKKIDQASDLAAEQCKDGAVGDPGTILATVFADYL
jgi:hypothetical protein